MMNKTQRHKPKGAYERLIKRPMDFLAALLLIVLFSPVLLALAILVKVRLGSPILFKQQRPGKDGNIFIMYKFRSMINSEEGIIDPTQDSARLTPFGRKLRATSLDELPELFNVLKGNMSIIGPRPLLVQYLERYTPHQARRHEVRPGITGLAQVMGRNAISWEEKFDWDVRYVDSITFIQDVRILGLTIKKVFVREGISSNNTETMEEFTGDSNQ